MSWQHAADAVILDLADAVPELEKPRAAPISRRRSPSLHAGGLVFVRIHKELAYADIMASAWPGLTGSS